MRGYLAASMIALFLAGCQTTGTNKVGSGVPMTTPMALTSAQVQAVQIGVAASLKDPMSAMFGPVAAGKGSDASVYVCGYVNAKNSFGGYVGMKPYHGMLTGSDGKAPFLVVGMGGTDIQTMVTQEMCAKQGLNPI